VTDQSQGNSNDPGAKHAPCDPLQHFGESDQLEAGPKAEDQNTRRDGHHAGRDQQSFRPHGIDERATWHLAKQTGGAAYGQSKPDVFGCPPMYRQVGGGNRSKGGLHAGQKEVEPAQRKQALLRRRRRFADGPRRNDAHGWGYVGAGGVWT